MTTNLEIALGLHYAALTRRNDKCAPRAPRHFGCLACGLPPNSTVYWGHFARSNPRPTIAWPWPTRSSSASTTLRGPWQMHEHYAQSAISGEDV